MDCTPIIRAHQKQWFADLRKRVIDRCSVGNVSLENVRFSARHADCLFRFQQRFCSAPNQRDGESRIGKRQGGAAADAGAGARHRCEFL